MSMPAQRENPPSNFQLSASWKKVQASVCARRSIYLGPLEFKTEIMKYMCICICIYSTPPTPVGCQRGPVWKLGNYHRVSQNPIVDQFAFLLFHGYFGVPTCVNEPTARSRSPRSLHAHLAGLPQKQRWWLESAAHRVAHLGQPHCDLKCDEASEKTVYVGMGQKCVSKKIYGYASNWLKLCVSWA